ncbi:MAG: ABC transporter ATP-binding protein [Janthinobacterium lividum]
MNVGTVAERVGDGVEAPVVLEARALGRDYAVKGGVLRAVDDVSFRLRRGRTLAVVGESGCGKSTLARMATLLERPSAGELLVEGQASTGLRGRARRALGLSVQMVFQNPFGALNPRQSIGATLREPLAINRRGGRTKQAEAAREMMRRVGLRPEQEARTPHEFSGGQRQRIAIARALMLRPPVVVADEPVSALDVSIQAQVLNLLLDLQGEFGLAYLFISHDLSVVRHVADEVLVMYLGRVAEHGPASVVLRDPRHPYTQALLAATPSLDPARRAPAPLAGEMPSPVAPPRACAFVARCPRAEARCREERPALRPVEGRLVSCHFAETTGLAAETAPQS